MSSLAVFSSMNGVMWVWTRVSHWFRLISSGNFISIISFVIVLTMYDGSVELDDDDDEEEVEDEAGLIDELTVFTFIELPFRVVLEFMF